MLSSKFLLSALKESRRKLELCINIKSGIMYNIELFYVI